MAVFRRLLRPRAPRLQPETARGGIFEQLEARRLLCGACSGAWATPDPEASCPCGGVGACPGCAPVFASTANITSEEDFAVTINFQPAALGPVEFTRADFGRPFAQRGNGLSYGWNRNLQAAGDVIDRQSDRELIGLSFGGNVGNAPEGANQQVDKRFDTFARVDPGDSWSIQVPNGTYAVALVTGDPEFQGTPGQQAHSWDANGVRVMRAWPLGSYPWGETLFYTEVTDGMLTLEAADESQGNSLSWLRLARIPNPPSYGQGQEIEWRIDDELMSPVARIEGGTVRLGDRLYAIGGFGPEYATVHRRMDILDLETFEWSRGADLPEGVPETHTGFAGDPGRGHIYWISGQIGVGEGAGVFETTPATWRYVVAEDRWERFVDLPEARYGGAAIVVGDRLYFFGGNDETRIVARGHSWSIDLAQTPTDTTGDGVPDSPAWEPVATMPIAADHLNAEHIDGRIYITGGEYAHGIGYVQRAELQIYDIAEDSWTLGAPLPTPSSHNRSVVHNDRIWVFGGQREAQRVISEVRSYNPATDVWELHDPMPQTRKVGYLFVKDDTFYYISGDAWLDGFPLTTLVGELR